MTDPGDFPLRQPLASDAPLVAELVGLPNARAGLRRRLDPALASQERARDAFLAEIRALARIRAASPFLVPLVDARDDEEPWLVRDFAEEGTLAGRLAAGPPLSGGELLTAAECVLSGLEELSALGLTHGDPGPSNLLLTKTGGLKLADAMSSRRAYAEGESPADPAGRDRRRAAAWLVRAAAGAAPRDPLAFELARALENAAPEIAILRVFRLTQERAALRRPVAPPPKGGRPAPRSPSPLRVVVSLGPFVDERLAYRAARLVADATGEPFTEVRRTLLSTTKVFDSVWPEPGRSFFAACESGRVPVQLREAPAPELPVR